MDMAGAIREALEVVWKNEKTERKKRKSQSRNGSLIWTLFLILKRNRFGAEITCDNDLGGSKW